MLARSSVEEIGGQTFAQASKVIILSSATKRKIPRKEQRQGVKGETSTVSRTQKLSSVHYPCRNMQLPVSEHRDLIALHLETSTYCCFLARPLKEVGRKWGSLS